MAMRNVDKKIDYLTRKKAEAEAAGAVWDDGPRQRLIADREARLASAAAPVARRHVLPFGPLLSRGSLAELSRMRDAGEEVGYERYLAAVESARR